VDVSWQLILHHISPWCADIFLSCLCCDPFFQSAFLCRYDSNQVLEIYTHLACIPLLSCLGSDNLNFTLKSPLFSDDPKYHTGQSKWVCLQHSCVTKIFAGWPLSIDDLIIVLRWCCARQRNYISYKHVIWHFIKWNFVLSLISHFWRFLMKWKTRLPNWDYQLFLK
jgi:hypothetical protein